MRKAMLPAGALVILAIGIVVGALAIPRETVTILLSASYPAQPSENGGCSLAAIEEVLHKYGFCWVGIHGDTGDGAHYPYKHADSKRLTASVTTRFVPGDAGAEEVVTSVVVRLERSTWSKVGDLYRMFAELHELRSGEAEVSGTLFGSASKNTGTGQP